jgi:hypothetical protein
LGSIVTNENCIHEEMNSKLNLVNAYYHSVQNILSSHFLSKNVKSKIYKKTINLSVLYGCETWSLRLCKDHRLRMSEYGMLRRISGPKREEVGKVGENCIM